MKTTAINCINEKDRTIELAQSVINIDESLHCAVLNARIYTIDELMYQHKIFTENTEIFDTFRDKIHSCLRVPRKCLQGLLLNMGKMFSFVGL
ncbi:hypothetical protein Osc1_14820 [Hominimerdicola sp. 21CYCFAH17_S]